MAVQGFFGGVLLGVDHRTDYVRGCRASGCPIRPSLRQACQAVSGPGEAPGLTLGYAHGLADDLADFREVGQGVEPAQ